MTVYLESGKISPGHRYGNKSEQVIELLKEILEHPDNRTISTFFEPDGMCTDSQVINYLQNYYSTSDDHYLNSRPALKLLFYCIYALIFATGVFGNMLVCYVVLRNKQMHTVTNLFITNLALSDILLCMLTVTLTPLYLIYFRDWVFGPLLCRLLPFAQGVSVYISAFTLMSIAIDRYFVIIYPFKPRMKISICLLIVTSVWLSAVLLTLPYAYFMDVQPEHRLCSRRLLCDERWPEESMRQAFGFSTSVLQFVIPFTIISFCYIRVCGKLSVRARSKPGEKSLRKDEVEKERTRRTNRMLIAMVIIFGCSWLPLNIYNLISDFYPATGRWPYAEPFFFLAHAVAMSSTCYNPFLYAWLNENFRKEFKQVLPCYSNVVRGSSISIVTSGTQLVRKTTANSGNVGDGGGGGGSGSKATSSGRKGFTSGDTSIGKQDNSRKNKVNHRPHGDHDDTGEGTDDANALLYAGSHHHSKKNSKSSLKNAIGLKVFSSNLAKENDGSSQKCDLYDQEEGGEDGEIDHEMETHIQELDDNQSDHEESIDTVTNAIKNNTSVQFSSKSESVQMKIHSNSIGSREIL